MTVNVKNAIPQPVSFEKIAVGEFFAAFLPSNSFETDGYINYLYLKLSSSSAYSFKSNVVYPSTEFKGLYYPLVVEGINASLKQ